MRFDIQIPITGGAANDPNPRTTPAGVPEANVAKLGDAQSGTDTAPQTLLMALEGTAGQQVTAQLWLLEDPANSPDFADPKAEKLGREYYQYGDALVLTVGTVGTPTFTAGAATTIKLPCPTGRFYVQLTTKPAANAVLKLGTLGA